MGRGVAEVRFSCGHAALFRSPPRARDWVWCTRCDEGVQVEERVSRIAKREARSMDHGPLTTVLRRGRRRRTVDRRTRATDWASGPQATVVLLCGHVRQYRPPTPAKGDWITCGCCGAATLVIRPIRRSDRHGGPWDSWELGVPIRVPTSPQ